VSLCTPTRCGCSITSDTLSVVNYGDVINLEVAAAANSYPTFNFLDAAERDSELASPLKGWEAWLRSTNQKTRYNGTQWRIIAQPRTAFVPSALTLPPGFVVAGGSLSLFYSRANDDVFYNGRFVFGAGSAFNGGYFPIPVPPANSNRNVGEAGIYDASTNIIHPVQTEVHPLGQVFYVDSGSAVFTVNSTAPITWSNIDELWWNVRYPAA
jgi:hypothetical protein